MVCVIFEKVRRREAPRLNSGRGGKRERGFHKPRAHGPSREKLNEKDLDEGVFV